MPLDIPPLAHLMTVRSRLTEDVLRYLAILRDNSSNLPGYYPEHIAFADGGSGDVHRRRLVTNLMESNRNQVIIAGGPGLGKTSMLRQEASALAAKAFDGLNAQRLTLREVTIPVFLHLQRDANTNDEAFEDALVAQAVRLAGISPTQSGFRDFVRDRIRTGGSVILLDAWDETPVELPPPGQSVTFSAGYRQNLGLRVRAFVAARPQARLVVSTRSAEEVLQILPGAHVVDLEPLAEPEVASFVHRWSDNRLNGPEVSAFLERLRRHEGFKSLSRIPLMLALVCKAWLPGHGAAVDLRGNLPNRRSDLYEFCLRGLLGAWQRDDKSRPITEARVDATIDLLSLISLDLLQDGLESFDHTQLRDAIFRQQARLRTSHELRSWTPADVIDELLKAGIIVPLPFTSGLTFIHSTFQYFLTACALAREVDEPDGLESSPGQTGWHGVQQKLERRLKRPELTSWHEVTVLLAGRLRDPSLLLRFLTAARTDDPFRLHLALAGQALPEISSSAQARLAIRTRAGDEPRALGLTRPAPVDDVASALFEAWWDVDEATSRGHLSRGLQGAWRANSDAVSRLIRRGLRGNAIVRRRAAMAVGTIGAARLDVVDALGQISGSREPGDREAAIRALGSLGPDEVSPQLAARVVAGCEDADPEVRAASVEAVNRLAARGVELGAEASVPSRPC